MPFPTPFSSWPWAAGLYAGSLLFSLLRKERTALALFCAGFVVNTLFLIGRCLYFGAFTPVNMVTGTYLLPWCLVLLIGIVRLYERNRRALSFAILPVFFFSLAALFVPVEAYPPSPQHDSVFAPFFFIFEAMAYACFVLGGWYALLCMIRKRENADFNTLIVWGFVLYSLAQLVGGVWAYLGWGAPFHWSERHLQSAAIWCFYAAYLHLHFSPKWSLEKRIRFAAIGPVILILFSYAYYIT